MLGQLYYIILGRWKSSGRRAGGKRLFRCRDREASSSQSVGALASRPVSQWPFGKSSCRSGPQNLSPAGKCTSPLSCATLACFLVCIDVADWLGGWDDEEEEEDILLSHRCRNFGSSSSVCLSVSLSVRDHNLSGKKAGLGQGCLCV